MPSKLPGLLWSGVGVPACRSPSLPEGHLEFRSESDRGPKVSCQCLLLGVRWVRDPRLPHGWGWGGAMSLGRSLASCQDISVTKKEVSVPGRTGGGGLMKLEALAEGPVLCSDALPSALSV